AAARNISFRNRCLSRQFRRGHIGAVLRRNLMRQTVEQQAAAADVKMAELVANYRNSPEGKLRQDKENLQRMQQGNMRHDNAAAEAHLERQIAAGERAAAQATMPTVLTDAQRIDRIVNGVPLPTGPETTSEGQ